MKWSDAEILRLREVYEAAPPLRLEALAKELGREKANVCRKARGLGLTNQARPKVPVPKGRPRKFATDQELRAHLSERAKRQIAERGHPRGMLGVKHTPETIAKMAEASRRGWANPFSGHHTEERKQKASDNLLARIARGEMRSGYVRSAGGRRADLDNRYFRSAWEANYARYLNWRKARAELESWDYEAKTFVFEAIKRGTRAYTPDFKLTFPDGRIEWHEVKGWMDPQSKTRLKRMGKYYPQEVVRVVDEAWFRMAHKSGLAAVIPNWERGRNRGSRGA